MLHINLKAADTSGLLISFVDIQNIAQNAKTNTIHGSTMSTLPRPGKLVKIIKDNNWKSPFDVVQDKADMSRKKIIRTEIVQCLFLRKCTIVERAYQMVFLDEDKVWITNLRLTKPQMGGFWVVIDV